MRKKRSAAALKARVEEKKPKVEVKHETSEEEDELDHEEETQEVEESESEEVKEEEEEEEVEEEEEEEEEEVEEEIEEEEEEVEEEEEDEESDEEDESSKKETLRKLLDPLPKDKIIELLKEAAINDRSIVSRLTQAAESDPAHRKIFVFGLAWDATADQILSVLKQYGEIEECKVVTDKITGRTKGYAFVLFKTRKSAQKALKQPQKKIGSRMAMCQLASAGPGGPTTATSDPTARKIFVANVGSHVNPNALKSYFAKFGEIEEGPLGVDNSTGKFKGFAMFIYKTSEGCKKALEEPIKVFDGCQLHCRQAVDNQRGNKNTKSLPQSDLGSMAYSYGGFYGPQLVNPAAGLMVGQNPMLVSALNQGSMSPGLSAGYGLNPVSPSVMASYGSQLGLQGLEAYRNSQVGRSSGGTTAAAVAARQQSGLGSLGANFPSYLGR